MKFPGLTLKNTLANLRKNSATIVHGVNVRKRDWFAGEAENKMKFDKIIFNFPHCGSTKNIVEIDKQMVLENTSLLKCFLRNGKKYK
jgi:hypothetical protein